MISRRQFSKLTLGLGVALGHNFPHSAIALDLPNSNPLRAEVYNRGRAPRAFLEKLVEWGRSAPESLFAVRPGYDVYSHVAYKLGPWTGLPHRRAAMLEVLRVLGGFESSWEWSAGVDVGKLEPNTAMTEEAGIFQISCNSMYQRPALRNLLIQTAGSDECEDFITTMKADQDFALRFCALLLRHTIRHHGPLRRTEHNPSNPRASSIHPFLSREAVSEFERLLAL